MTMVICNECKAQTSTLATACLHCGAARRKAPNDAVVAIAFLGLAVLVTTWMLWRLYDVEPRAIGHGIAQRAPASQ